MVSVRAHLSPPAQWVMQQVLLRAVQAHVGSSCKAGGGWSHVGSASNLFFHPVVTSSESAFLLILPKIITKREGN